MQPVHLDQNACMVVCRCADGCSNHLRYMHWCTGRGGGGFTTSMCVCVCYAVRLLNNQGILGSMHPAGAALRQELGC
jgi:hypothetical protein